jgi:hypothetical protein
MIRPHPLRALLAALPLAALAAGDDTVVRFYRVPGHGTLQLAVPVSWKESVSVQGPGLPPTVAFSPPEGSGFSVQITPLWSPAADPAFNRPESVRPLVARMGRQHLGSAVETDLVLREIRGEAVAGYVFTLTDRAPAEGGWRYLTAGAAGAGDLLLSFTVLTHSLDSGDLDAALRLIRSARQVDVPASSATPGTGSVSSGLRKVTYPGKTWSLVLELPGFEIKDRSVRPDASGVRVYGENRDTGVHISIFLEKAGRAGDAKVCRDFYWKKRSRAAVKRDDVRFSERDGMALVEYLVRHFRGRLVNHRNLNAYMSHDGVWVDIHLSKIDFRPEHQDLFEAILATVRIAGPDPASGGGAVRPGSTFHSACFY